MQLKFLFVYSDWLTFTFEEVGGELMDTWGLGGELMDTSIRGD